MDVKYLNSQLERSQKEVNSAINRLNKFVNRERSASSALLEHAETNVNAPVLRKYIQRMQSQVLSTVAKSLSELSHETKHNDLLLVFALKLASNLKEADQKFKDAAFLEDCGVDIHDLKFGLLATQRSSPSTSNEESTESPLER